MDLLWASASIGLVYPVRGHCSLRAPGEHVAGLLRVNHPFPYIVLPLVHNPIVANKHKQVGLRVLLQKVTVAAIRSNRSRDLACNLSNITLNSTGSRVLQLEFGRSCQVGGRAGNKTGL